MLPLHSNGARKRTSVADSEGLDVGLSSWASDDSLRSASILRQHIVSSTLDVIKNREASRWIYAYFAVVVVAAFFCYVTVGDGYTDVCRDLSRSPARPILPVIELPRFDRFFVAVMHHTNLDMLISALESAHPAFAGHLLVVDNSDTMEAFQHHRIRELAQVYAAPVPLHFTQTQNFMQALAISSGCEFFGFMHSDAELKDSKAVLKALEDKIADLRSNAHHWGVIFTNYDALAIFNTVAIQQVGQWDTTFLQYTSDLDYYERLQLDGFEEHTVAKDLVLHKVSGTLKSNSCFRTRIDSVIDFGRQYYAQKWGVDNLAHAHIVYRYPFEYSLKKQQLRRRVFLVVLCLAPAFFLSYRCWKKKIINRDTVVMVAWWVFTMAIAYPGRQLLFDADVLSK